MPNLKEKSDYSELTELQQSIVDAVIEHPGKTQKQVADIVGCDSSTVSHTTTTYNNIIEGRKEELTGLDLLFKEESEDFQAIQDRPVKNTEGSSIDSTPEDNGSDTIEVSMEFTEDEVRNLLKGGTSLGEARDKVTDALTDRMFRP